jgi:hypothetical protein
MSTKWSLFVAAAFFASYLLVSRGVPIIPVVVGIAAAALFTWRKQSHAVRRNR